MLVRAINTLHIHGHAGLILPGTVLELNEGPDLDFFLSQKAAELVENVTPSVIIIENVVEDKVKVKRQKIETAEESGLID